MLTRKQIQKIVDQIVKGYQPEKIILFGSYATGKPNSDSDLDFCIIKQTDKRISERPREVHQLFDPYLWPMDVFVRTPGEFAKRKKVYGTLEYIADTTGKIVYGN